MYTRFQEKSNHFTIKLFLNFYHLYFLISLFLSPTLIPPWCKVSKENMGDDDGGANLPKKTWCDDDGSAKLPEKTWFDMMMMSKCLCFRVCLSLRVRLFLRC